MMWCFRCHYGSEVCRLIPVGGTGTIDIPVPGDKKKTMKVARALTKCPQCGLVSAEHLIKSPFKGKRTHKEHKTHKGKKKTTDQIREQEAQESKG